MPQAKTKETFKSPKHMKRSYQTHNKVLPFTPNNIIANFSWGSEYSKVWTRKFNLTRKTVVVETPQMPCYLWSKTSLPNWRIKMKALYGNNRQKLRTNKKCILNVETKLNQLGSNPTKLREDQLHRYLPKLNSKGFLDESVSDCIYHQVLFPLDYMAHLKFIRVRKSLAYHLWDALIFSYDVSSLFTNITLCETIDIAVQLILENKKVLNFWKMN